MMQSNVYSFKVAIANGCLYQQYSYEVNKIPLGEFDARLDFKIWSKRILAINCYFTKIYTGEKLVVAVYANSETARFQLLHSTIDFAHCAVNEMYHLLIVKTDKAKVLLVKAEPAQHVTK